MSQFDFNTLPNEVMNNPRLMVNDKILYWFLASRRQTERYLKSLDDIKGYFIGMSRPEILMAAQGLEQQGYLQVIVNDNSPNQWVIYMEKQDIQKMYGTTHFCNPKELPIQIIIDWEDF